MRRIFFYTLGLLLLSMFASVFLSCSEDGENPYVLWHKYTHPGTEFSAFSFYYMAPPFNIVQSGEHPILVVDAYDTPTDGDLEARIYVEAWQSSNTASEELDDRIVKWNRKGYGDERYISYVNYFGDEGAMLVMERQDHWVKEIFYEFRSGCVVISAATNERGSRDDIEFLLAGFRPGSDEP